MQLKDGIFVRLVLGNGSCLRNKPTKSRWVMILNCVFPFFRVPGAIDNVFRPITPCSRRADRSEWRERCHYYCRHWWTRDKRQVHSQQNTRQLGTILNTSTIGDVVIEKLFNEAHPYDCYSSLEQAWSDLCSYRVWSWSNYCSLWPFFSNLHVYSKCCMLFRKKRLGVLKNIGHWPIPILL